MAINSTKLYLVMPGIILIYRLHMGIVPLVTYNSIVIRCEDGITNNDIVYKNTREERDGKGL